MTTPNSFDLTLDPTPDEPLSPTAREARDAMLEPLRARVIARRRRRVAVRAAAACVLILGTIVGVRAFTAPMPGPIPEREIAVQPTTTPPTPPTPPAPILTPEQPKKFAITIIKTDPTVLERLTAKPPATPLITAMSDDELLDALEAAGTPGLIKINGKVVLSRDLFKPADPDIKPQSLVPTADPTHG